MGDTPGCPQAALQGREDGGGAGGMGRDARICIPHATPVLLNGPSRLLCQGRCSLVCPPRRRAATAASEPGIELGCAHLSFTFSGLPPPPQERGYSGIELERVQDAWVRGVRVVNVDNGFLVSNSNRVTLQVWLAGVRC